MGRWEGEAGEVREVGAGISSPRQLPGSVQAVWARGESESSRKETLEDPDYPQENPASLWGPRCPIFGLWLS